MMLEWPQWFLLMRLQRCPFGEDAHRFWERALWVSAFQGAITKLKPVTVAFLRSGAARITTEPQPPMSITARVPSSLRSVQPIRAA